MLAKLDEARAGIARRCLLLLRSRAAGPMIVATAVFALVAGVGALTSYVADVPEGTGSGDGTSFLLSPSDSNDEMLTRLTDYTLSWNKDPSSMAAGGQLLSDASTMIEQLAARLETTPDDIEGWRMLGWSYFHTARYEQAAVAYSRAVELDPHSSELKLLYEEAKAKAGANGNATALSLQAQVGGDGVERSGDEKPTKTETLAPSDHDAQIEAMVDGLADRLQRSPHDVEGWTLLMRSQVVLGEREVAATTFRKALQALKDDETASDKITAAAIKLGLKIGAEDVVK